VAKAPTFQSLLDPVYRFYIFLFGAYGFFIHLSYTGSLNWQVITFVRVQKCCHFLNIENMKTGYKLLNSLII